MMSWLAEHWGELVAGGAVVVVILGAMFGDRIRVMWDE